MNNKIKLFFLTSLFLSVLCIFSLTTFAEAPTSAEQLKNRLVEAINSKDEEKLSALFYWEGVDAQMKPLSERVIESIIDGEVKSTELLPLPDDFRTEFLKNGIRYRPNIKLLGIIKISYKERGNEILGDSKIAYGEVNGKYYLPNTITEKTDYTGPEDKTININIIGTSSPEPVLFEGYCIYNVSGEEKKKVIKGKGNISEAFWGQDVKSCKIRRLSDTGSLKLIINVGGNNVFETEMKETNEINYP